MSREFTVQILPGLPPPAPVSSQIFVGVTVLGIHQEAGTERIDVISGGSSEMKEEIRIIGEK